MSNVQKPTVFKIDLEWFDGVDEVQSVVVGRFAFNVDVSSVLSQKTLSKLYSQGKPYIVIEGEEKIQEVIEEVIEKPIHKRIKKSKKKNIKIDEPKESEPETYINNSDEEES